MVINCLLQNIENNTLNLYNPNTKENFNVQVSDEEVEIYKALLEESKNESLNIDDFNEPAIAIVGFDTKKQTITEPN